MVSRPRRYAAALAALLVLTGGCGTADSIPESAPSATATATASATGAPSAAAAATSSAPTPTPAAPPRRLRGIDASHHQGEIDWRQVAADRIDFAYLKATEGSGFTDPRFAANVRAARAEGLRVGGYHYYTLCAPPEPQAAHFAEVIGTAGRLSLPPVVDLELIGNCDPPPERAVLLAQVRTFVEQVEAATGRRVVVYFHPDFEARYAMVAALDRRLWVRRVGNRPPPGDWWIWQRDDAASVAGVEGPVDLDILRPPGR